MAKLCSKTGSETKPVGWKLTHGGVGWPSWMPPPAVVPALGAFRLSGPHIASRRPQGRCLDLHEPLGQSGFISSVWGIGKS